MSAIYGYILAGIIALGLLGAIKVQSTRLDLAKISLKAALIKVKTADENEIKLREVIKANQGAWQECTAINESNRLEAESYANRAFIAEAKISRLIELSTIKINSIGDQVNEYRKAADKTCRTLTDPLPDDFVNRVYQ